jgi:hypothetical protein
MADTFAQEVDFFSIGSNGPCAILRISSPTLGCSIVAPLV